MLYTIRTLSTSTSECTSAPQHILRDGERVFRNTSPTAGDEEWSLSYLDLTPCRRRLGVLAGGYPNPPYKWWNWTTITTPASPTRSGRHNYRPSKKRPQTRRGCHSGRGPKYDDDLKPSHVDGPPFIRVDALCSEKATRRRRPIASPPSAPIGEVMQPTSWRTWPGNLLIR